MLRNISIGIRIIVIIGVLAFTIVGLMVTVYFTAYSVKNSSIAGTEQVMLEGQQEKIKLGTQSMVWAINTLVIEIKDSMEEQSRGSGMILQSLEQINGITERVQTGAEKIKTESDQSINATVKLTDMNATMQQEITGIVAQVGRVSESAQAAHATVSQNNEGLSSLYGAITRFRMR